MLILEYHMAVKQGQRTDKLSFIGGFNTEANLVNFPPDYTIDEFNFELKIDGSRERRLGLSLESRIFPSSDIETKNKTVYVWKNVASIAGLDLIVVQMNKSLYMFNADGEDISDSFVCSCELTEFSGNLFSFAAIDGKLVVVDGDAKIAVCEYSNGNVSISYDQLKVRDQWGVEEATTTSEARTLSGSFKANSFGSFTETVTFNTAFNSTPSVSVETNNPLISHTVDSVNETGMTITYNIPPSSSGESILIWKASGYVNASKEEDENQRVANNPFRRYNLQNQGWNVSRKNSAGAFVDPLDYFSSGHTNLLPANNESVYTGLQYQAGFWNGDVWTEPWERMYLHMYDDSMESADTKIAKGAFIIDLLDRGEGRKRAVQDNLKRYPNLSTFSFEKEDKSLGGPSCVADFSGHVFFGGFSGESSGGDSKSPNLSSYVAFSQLVKSSSDVFKCYQEGNPTSRESNDLVDTDGGLIRLSGAENILDMRVCSKGLLVFATNGVWLILGGSDYGFTATNYKQQKLTEFGAISRESIVGEDSVIYYWGSDGIYQIAPDQFGDLQTNKVSLTTIQSFYNSIPYEKRMTVSGAFDEISRKIRWIYDSNEDFTDELCLDIQLKAFTKNRFYHTRYYSRIIKPIGLISPRELVFAEGSRYYSHVYLIACEFRLFIYSTDEEGNTLYDELGNPLISNTVYVKGFTFGKPINMEFLDFKELDGEGKDAEAYILTGCNTAGDSGVPKQIPYLIMYFKRTETEGTEDEPSNKSSCIVSSRWDWSNNDNSNRWSIPFQAYRIRQPVLLSQNNFNISDYDVVVTKNKIRGRGKSFAFHLQTEPLKDCKLLGWNITLNGNSIT